MRDKPERLFYVGGHDVRGNPMRFFGDIPARDLDADDLAGLTDEQVERAAASDLYQRTKPSGAKAADAPSRPRPKPTRDAVAEQADEPPAPVDDEPAAAPAAPDGAEE
jgi:hypothetical protein